MEVLIILLLTTAYLLFCGYGLYISLTPNFLKERLLSPFLIITWGILLNLFVCTHAFFLDLSVSRGLTFSGIFATLILIWSVFLKPAIFFRLPKQIFRILKTYALKCTILFITLLIIISPGIRGDSITVPFRIGIDQTAYTETAQYLLQGGTRSVLKSKLQYSTGTNNFADSMKAKERDLNFNTYVDADFLLQNRFGFQALTAELSKLNNVSHVYNIMFLNMIFSFFLLFGFSFYFFRKFGPKLFKRWSFWSALIILLNCNLLNVFYEGQYGQVFTVPFAVLITLIYFHFKNSTNLSGLQFSSERNKSIFLTSMVIVGILPSYSEYVVALVILIGFTYVIDLVLFKKNYTSLVLGAATSLLLALLFIAKFSFHWIGNVLFNYWVKNIPHAGFWQPHWAMPSEVLGFSDIYHNPGYQLIARSPTEHILNIGLSLLIFISFLLYFWRARDRNKSFYLASTLIILTIFVKTFFISPTINYQYYKSYTFLMPWIYFLFFASMEHSYYSICSNKHLRCFITSHIFSIVIVTLCVFSFATGLRYVEKYRFESEYVTKDMMDLRVLSSKIDINNYVVVTGKSRIAEYMLTPLFSFNWANQSQDKYLLLSLSKKVLILLNKNDIRCPQCFIADNSKDILYENGSYIFINSGQPLSDFFMISPETGNDYFPDFSLLFTRYKLNEEFLSK